MNEKEIERFIAGLKQEQNDVVTSDFFNNVDEVIEELETEIVGMKKEVYCKEKAVKILKWIKSDIIENFE